MSIRKKTTGCPKDKIPPLVGPLVAKCQGLGKFSSVLARVKQIPFEHHLPLSSALLQRPPSQPTVCALAGPEQEPVREQLPVLQCAQQLLALLAPEAVGMPRWNWKLAWGQHWLPLGIEVPPRTKQSDIVQFSGKSVSVCFNICELLSP